VAHNLLVSHGLACEALRAALPAEAQVGVALDFVPVYPASDDAEDVAAAARMDGYRNRLFADPVLRGRYPADLLALCERAIGPLDWIEPGDLERIAAPIDFLGVNFYTPATVRAALEPEDVFAFEQLPPATPTTDLGWEVRPPALYDLLVRIRRDYGEIPILITENGAAYADVLGSDGVVEDPRRVAYLRDHVAEVERAVQAGVPVEGYFVWSLLDNFEWHHGYSKRFGIVYVDFETQRRVPKRSALWYRDRIAATANGR
jgi:beta-glucosidase